MFLRYHFLYPKTMPLYRNCPLCRAVTSMVAITNDAFAKWYLRWPMTEKRGAGVKMGVSQSVFGTFTRNCLLIRIFSLILRLVFILNRLSSVLARANTIINRHRRLNVSYWPLASPPLPITDSQLQEIDAEGKFQRLLSHTSVPMRKML